MMTAAPEFEYGPNRYRNLRKVRIIQVIEVTTLEGSGTIPDPCWERHSYFDTAGIMIWQDPNPS